MTALAAFQEALQRRVLHGEPSRGNRPIEAGIAGRAQDVAGRLAIYEHAYRARLTEALTASYPVLRKRIGRAAFEALAADHIARNPPAHASIRWYGAELQRGLQGMHADLARWEWLLAEVFDAANGAAMTEADLASLAPQEWPFLELQLHRTARTYESTTNAVECWRAASAEGPPPDSRDAAPVAWVAWRQGLTVMFRSMPPHEAQAVARLAEGISFAELCAGLATSADAAALRAASLLKGWIGEGLIGKPGEAVR